MSLGPRIALEKSTNLSRQPNITTLRHRR